MVKKTTFKVGSKVYVTTNPTFDISKQDRVLEGKVIKRRYKRKYEMYTYTIELKSGKIIERNECDVYSSYEETAQDIAYNQAEIREDLSMQIYDLETQLETLKKQCLRVDAKYNKWIAIAYPEA